MYNYVLHAVIQMMYVLLTVPRCMHALNLGMHDCIGGGGDIECTATEPDHSGVSTLKSDIVVIV